MPIRVAGMCLVAGAVLIMAGANVGHPVWWYVAGTLMAGAFVPYFLKGPKENWKRFVGTWCALAIVTAFCTWTEALVFAPKAIPQPAAMLFGSMFMYSLLAGAIALCGGVLKVRSSETGAAPSVSFGKVALGVVGGGIAYLVYYYVFGGLFYQLLTKPYYTGSGPLGAAEQVVAAMGFWFPAIQVGRGMLMTLGLLPVILGTRMSKVSLAIYVGTLIWVIGGLAPLLPPNPFMPTGLRVMHIFEILTQNFSLGFTVVYLIRGREKVVEKPLAVAAA